ncbi:MAG: carbamoyltransferase HypF [Deltaproteobacteria bacterium]|nr:carbamoyltransferase HypF [Deltaproteobacteria bacterium]
MRRGQRGHPHQPEHQQHRARHETFRSADVADNVPERPDAAYGDAAARLRPMYFVFGAHAGRGIRRRRGAPGGTMLNVVGVGSAWGRDDAIGLALVESLPSDDRCATTLLEDADALTLAEWLISKDGPVVVVDAADMGLAGGAWRFFSRDEAALATRSDSCSTHGFGIADALALAANLGFEQPTYVFGVQPFDLSPAMGLTPEMSARLSDLATALRNALDEISPPEIVRVVVSVEGVVQGVGFRPTLKRLADAAGLGGSIRNRGGDVLIALEGPTTRVDAFLEQLPTRLPTNAGITSLHVVSRDRVEDPAAVFKIIESDVSTTPRPSIPADLAICDECAREIFDPSNRRYGYAFTTCTACGPRYTVVDALPYDRERTTMAPFDLCPECAREYHDVHDRRYHAESIACPTCGPRLSLLDNRGRPIPGSALAESRRLLAEGGIVALRGIGGFQLVVDATNRDAVAELRRRKHRPHKPLAVMARSLDVVRQVATLTDEQAGLLRSPAGPIVILDMHRDACRLVGLPLDVLNPDTDTLGIMLPTSPLHHLLYTPIRDDATPPFDWLVATSGNAGGAPIVLSTDEALRELVDIADAVLTHNREIRLRNDDSLVTVIDGAPQVLRRARGFAPEAIPLSRPLRRAVLAFGGELKNTVALGYGNSVALSPHIGDLSSPACVDALEEAVARLLDFHRVSPEVVAVDRHPDYQATIAGRRFAERHGLPLVEVQHHHAHAVACLAEHQIDDALALVWDGTGYGDDGAIRGAELFDAYGDEFTRIGTFAPSKLLGGDSATREPVRQAMARMIEAGATDDQIMTRLNIDAERLDIHRTQHRQNILTPATHAAGRVFDAVAALLGFAPDAITYEAQAAIRLESAARRAGSPPMSLPFREVHSEDGVTIDWTPAFVELTRMPTHQVREQRDELASAFHDAMARAALAMARFGRERTGRKTVALTGGVFMNRLLVELLVPRLRDAGFGVLMHRRVPPNDGGVALGQAIIAGRQ